MASITLTDQQINALLTVAKRVTNPRSKSRTVNKSVSRDFIVVSDNEEDEFVLFTRQSTLITENFTAGLRWVSKTGEQIMLMRCNGYDHPHSNPLEREHLPPQTHVHMATERYIAIGRKTEHYAIPVDAYRTLDGALHELTIRANIRGLLTTPDHPDLFAQI